MKLIETENLSKTYHIGTIEVRALQGVSFVLEEGEFVAIMGPSGSGKSTLMHLIGFLDAPDQGRIFFKGKDVSALTEENYAQLRNESVGFVFQQFNLMKRSSALENVALPLMYSPYAASYAKRPAELLERVGLKDRMAHHPNELSGGQQQRVAVARALVNQPSLILADEPTGNLDSKSGREIMDLFKELHTQGMTIVIVTHDEKIGEEADRVIRMHDGKIIQDERRRQPMAGQLPARETPAAKESVSVFQSWKEHFKQSMRMILANKLRSFLSMLGVLIAVACVITMLALGRGARESVTEQLSRLGSNLLTVRQGSAKVRGVAMGADAGVTRITLEDARAIRESVASVSKVVPQVSGSAQVVAGSKNWNTRLTGTTSDHATVRNQEAVAGRFFTPEEDQARSRVVLLGQTVARELFGEENPVGKQIQINRVYFKVVGVLSSLGSDAFRDRDDMILIPVNTAMRRVLGKDYVDQIDVEIKTAEEIEGAQEEISNLIKRRHRIGPNDNESFNIRNNASMQEALSSTTKIFSVLLGSVAAISLLVGGIGIMNIMLVSVKERTREIGLRKAVGAAPRDILAQFLVEAVVITFMGGVAGMILAVGISFGVSVFAGWRTVISLGSILLAFFFSAAVGLIFGLWPAKQASELEPIQALRYE
ncbi:MAG TPA: ABC transporter permease [Candidatus Omnitrophota bacterium]|nr:ABC transporter permease [Candidatus Omnitrophota bacterium]